MDGVARRGLALMYVDVEDFTPEAWAKIRPTCGECGSAEQVDLAQGMIIYPNRPDLWAYDDGEERQWWLCSGCWAYCGVHRGTITPLGRPAGEATRKARQAAHAAFDPLWQKRQRLSRIPAGKARGKGYKWLAAQLGIDRKACHIGDMDAAMALRVVEICRGAR